MHLEIATSIVIQAPKNKVWEEFIQFDRYPEWNPFIKSLKGDVAVGNTLQVEITTMKFKPVVKVFKKEEELTWLGRLLIPKIFDGRHSFIFTSNDDGSTTMVHKEVFDGILVPLMRKKLNGEIRKGFIAMNERFKEKIESKK